MRFGQAFFGDIGRKHGLLVATLEDRERFLAIANRTDRPGYSPPDGPWPPYLSGFAHDDHYFLMRTFPDDAASRAGMVYTAAVVAPIEEFVQIENLQIVVDALPSTVVRTATGQLSQIDLDDSGLFMVQGEKVPAQLAQALVTNAPPIVWGDPSSFDEIVIKLWGRMWPSIRRVFSFRMSFDPNDIDQQNPAPLVTTLPAIRSRWVNSAFVVPSAPEPVLQPAAAMLTGDAAGDRLSKLRKDLESDVTDFRQLQVLQVLADTLDSTEQSFSSRRSQLQLAAKLSPSKSAGTDLKARLVEDLCARIPGEARAAEVRGVRNIPWDAMPSSESTRAFRAVSSWLTAHAFGTSTAGDSLDVLVADAFGDFSAWGSAVRLGLQHALESDDARIPTTLWSWLAGATGPHAEQLLKMYVSDSGRETRLADACPNLEGRSELSKQVLSSAKKERWSELHASVALKQGSASAGLAIHLKYLKGTEVVGIERFRLAVGNKEFLSLSVRLADLRLLDSAMRSLTDEPELWESLSPEVGFWRALLTKWASAERTRLGTAQSAHIVSKTLEYLGAQGEASSGENEVLWEVVAKVTPDWSPLEIPKEIWDRMPRKLRTTVLSATADGWLRRFLSGESVPVPDFAALRREVTEEVRIRSTLQENRNASTGVLLFEQLPELPERLFAWWVQAILPSLEVGQATGLRIGTLIATKHWRTAAEEFAKVALDRPVLRMGLEPCLPLFGVVRKIRLLIAGVPLSHHSIDLWQALQEMGLQLYPYGPGERSLWQRAGGDASDLPNFGSGREAWTTLMEQARNGRHDVTISSLLHSMRDDFPNNPDLRQIARLAGERETK